VTSERTTQAAVLAEVRQHVALLLSEIDTQPRSLHVQAGDVAVDIEWPELGRNGTRPVSTEAALAAPNGRRPVLAAPAVGVFYRCPEPGANPFVQEGDVVRAGQQVAIIESMKVMLPVEAECAGRIVDVLKGDGEPVEYGEPLFALAEGG
jgi:acetyl-CoA carboxylase biotin carboxyl carrier protein